MAQQRNAAHTEQHNPLPTGLAAKAAGSRQIKLKKGENQRTAKIDAHKKPGSNGRVCVSTLSGRSTESWLYDALSRARSQPLKTNKIHLALSHLLPEANTPATASHFPGTRRPPAETLRPPRSSALSPRPQAPRPLDPGRGRPQSTPE